MAWDVPLGSRRSRSRWRDRASAAGLPGGHRDGAASVGEAERELGSGARRPRADARVGTTALRCPRVTGSNRSQPKLRLRCEGCGLAYSAAALAREMVLSTGVTCRRCGGTLEA